jgi:hypothetical protein
MVDNVVTCQVLDGGANSYGNILYRDVRDPRQVSEILGSVGMRTDKIYPAPPAHFVVRFECTGTKFVPALLEGDLRAIAERFQQLGASASVQPLERLNKQWEREREFSAEGQRLLGLLTEARSRARTTQEAAEKLLVAGVDAEAALQDAAAADKAVAVLEHRLATRKPPQDREQRADADLAERRRALGEVIAQEAQAERAEARRQLAAATYKGADGIEVGMATLLENVAHADAKAAHFARRS